MPTRNINLTDHFDRVIDSEVRSGRYGNASEVVREALRLMEQRKAEERARLKWLRGAVREATEQIGRGEGVEYNSIEDLEKEIDRLVREAAGQARRKGRCA
jgi:antitoxin ParD1/3/4